MRTWPRLLLLFVAAGFGPAIRGDWIHLETLAIDPSAPEHLLAGTDQGLFVTFTGGE